MRTAGQPDAANRRQRRTRALDRTSRRSVIVRLVTGAALLAAAGTPLAAVAAATDVAQDSVTIQVTSNGWHSAIVVPRAAMPADVIPETADFPDAAFLSFSWGDAEYFPEPEPTFAMTLRAGLRPTPAVMHLLGLEAPVGVVFPSVEVVDLTVTAGGLHALIAYLDGSFDRGDADRITASEPGLYRFSKFYPATGKFHMLNTCNTWTARGLAAAGLPVDASGTKMADDLMTQIRPLTQSRTTN